MFKVKGNRTDDEIKFKVYSVPFWWHTIELLTPSGNLIKTPGKVQLEVQHYIASAIPEDLQGKSVLDIGAWDGLYSFICEQRGAERVLAIDIGYNVEGVPPDVGFRVIRELIDSKVEYRIMSVYDIDKLEENFDVIVFTGVYYHLRHPLLAFEKIYDKCRELVVVEGHVINDPRPIMEFYKTNEHDADPTCWWGPSVKCLVQMIESCGFSRIEHVGQVTVGLGRDRVLFRVYK
jgi:tRNA (mo5U34)-methyltransferase